jgi:glycosyltransferase involved in cell wall biosynthesis
MRVLLLSDFYPPVVGGVEQHVRMLGRGLAERGHEVAAASVHPGQGLPSREDDGGLDVRRLRSTLGRLPAAYAEPGRPFAPPAPDPELVVRLARLVHELRPQVVHAHGWILDSYLPLARSRRAGLVVTAHDYGVVCAKKNLLYRDAMCSGPSLRKCLGCAPDQYGLARATPIVLAELAAAPVRRSMADRWIAVSRAVVTGNELDDVDPVVIPNFLPDEGAGAADAGMTDDDSMTAEGRSLLTSLPPGPFLLFVGALGAHKGFPVLLEAYGRLAAPPPLVCIGHRWADTPADVPAGVTILEDWPNDAVRAAWRRSLFGLIPSVWAEPFGIVALEAMAAGKAVIASRVGGLGDVVVDGVTGVHVAPGDPGALAAAIRRMLADPGRRDAMGAAALDRVAAYRASAVLPRIEAVYRAAAARGSER